MPRLTNHEYLERRRILLWAWKNDFIAFDALTPPEQRKLHGYFAPDEPLSAAEALQYRKHVTKESPSLPHRAGRAYVKFKKAFDVQLARMAETTPPSARVKVKSADRGSYTGRGVRVTAIARPKLDLPRFARLIVSIAKEDERTGGELLRRLQERR